MNRNEKSNIFRRIMSVVVCFLVCVTMIPVKTLAYTQSSGTSEFANGGSNEDWNVPYVDYNGQKYYSVNFFNTTVSGVTYLRKENFIFSERMQKYMDEKFNDQLKNFKKDGYKQVKTEEEPEQVLTRIKSLSTANEYKEYEFTLTDGKTYSHDSDDQLPTKEEFAAAPVEKLPIKNTYYYLEKDEYEDAFGNTVYEKIKKTKKNGEIEYDKSSKKKKLEVTLKKPNKYEAAEQVLKEADGEIMTPECLPAVIYDKGVLGQYDSGIDTAYSTCNREQVMANGKNAIDYDGYIDDDKFPNQIFFDPAIPNQSIDDTYYKCTDPEKHQEYLDRGGYSERRLIEGKVYVHVIKAVNPDTGKLEELNKIYTLDGEETEYPVDAGDPVHAGLKYYYDVMYYCEPKRAQSFYSGNLDWGIDQGVAKKGYFTYFDPETGEETTKFGDFLIDVDPKYGEGLASRRMYFTAESNTQSRPNGGPEATPSLVIEFRVDPATPCTVDNYGSAVVQYKITYQTLSTELAEGSSALTGGTVLKEYDWIPIDGTPQTAPKTGVTYTPSPQLEYFFATGFDMDKYSTQADQQYDLYQQNYLGALDFDAQPTIAVYNTIAAGGSANFKNFLYKLRYTGWESMKGTIVELLEKPWGFISEEKGVQDFMKAVQAMAYSLLVLYFLIDLIGQILSFEFNLDALIGALVKLLIAKIIVDISPSLCEAMYRLTIEMIPRLGGAGGTGESIFVDGIVPKMNPNLFSGGTGAWKALNYAVDGIVFVLAFFLPRLAALMFGIILTLPFFMNGIVVILGWFQRLKLYLRFFEIAILYVLSPLAGASFVSKEFSGAGRAFLFGFAAICLETLIIIVGMRVIDTLCMITVPEATGTGIADFLINTLNPFDNIVNTLLPAVLMTTLLAKSREFAKEVLGQ